MNELTAINLKQFSGSNVAGRGENCGTVFTPPFIPINNDGSINSGSTNEQGRESQYGPGTGIIPDGHTTTTTQGNGATTKTIEVIDADGNPLVGAHVKWNGQGIITNASGYATLNVSNPETQVTISFLGKRSHIAKFKDLGSMITLQTQVNSLPPVVVGQPTTPPSTTENKGNTKLYLSIGIGIGALLLIAALSKKDNKKNSGLNAVRPKKKKGKKTTKKKRKGLREPVTIEI